MSGSDNPEGIYMLVEASTMESNELNFNSEPSSSLDSDDTNSSAGQSKKIDNHEQDLEIYPEQDES